MSGMRLTRLGDTGWSVVALFAAFAFVSFSTAVIGPVLGQLDDEFGVSYASLGLIAGMQALGRGVAMIPAGRVADRYPPRLLVSLGGVLMVVGSLASAAAPVYPILVFGTAVIGVSMALIFTAGMAHLIRSAPTGERGRTMGRAMAGWGLGSLLAPLAAGALASAFGWRSVFVLAAVLSVAVVAGTGTEGDALDNALFVMGPKKAQGYLKRYPQVQAYYFLPLKKKGWKMLSVPPAQTSESSD